MYGLFENRTSYAVEYFIGHQQSKVKLGLKSWDNLAMTSFSRVFEKLYKLGVIGLKIRREIFL